MSTACIFVSYAITGDEQGATVARQLIDDLRANGADVITDDRAIANDDFTRYLEQKLPRCQFFILVQTRQALKSLRVQTAVNIAFHMVAQQRMKGVWRILADPIESIEDQPSWVTPRTFDASRDYPRARDKVLLELGLLALEDEVPLLQRQSFAFTPLPSAPAPESSFPTEPQPVAPIAQPRALVPLDRPEPAGLLSRSQRLFMGGLALAVVLALVLGITLFRGPVVARGSAPTSIHLTTTTSASAPTSTVPAVATVNLGHTPTPGHTPTQAPVPTPTQVPARAVPTPTPTPGPQVMVDNLNDWSKVYSHTSNVGFDQNNSQWMHGDTSVLVRGTDSKEEVVWKFPHLSSFQAIVYFWPDQSSDPQEDMTVYTSPDGTNWTLTQPQLNELGGNWDKFVFSLSNLQQVNFIKMRWGTTGEDQIWAQQIGQVTLKSS